MAQLGKPNNFKGLRKWLPVFKGEGKMSCYSNYLTEGIEKSGVITDAYGVIIEKFPMNLNNINRLRAEYARKRDELWKIDNELARLEKALENIQ